MNDNCPSACQQCEACKPDDTACINRNRKKLGLLLYDDAELDA